MPSWVWCRADHQSVTMAVCPHGCGVSGDLSMFLGDSLTTLHSNHCICHLYNDFFSQTHHWLGKPIPFVLWVVTPLTKAVLKCWLMANGAPSVMITGALSMHRYMSWVIQEYTNFYWVTLFNVGLLFTWQCFVWDRGDIKVTGTRWPEVKSN